jgi:hypothetical protein
MALNDHREYVELGLGTGLGSTIPRTIHRGLNSIHRDAHERARLARHQSRVMVNAGAGGRKVTDKTKWI